MFSKIKNWFISRYRYGAEGFTALLIGGILVLVGLPLPIIAGFDIESKQFSENIPAMISYGVFAIGISVIFTVFAAWLGGKMIRCLEEEQSSSYSYGFITDSKTAEQRAKQES